MFDPGISFFLKYGKPFTKYFSNISGLLDMYIKRKLALVGDNCSWIAMFAAGLRQT